MKRILLSMGIAAVAFAANAQQKLVVVHNCPDPAAATVDVWVRVPSFNLNQKVIDNIPFRNYFVYSVPAVPPGTAVSIDIKGENSVGADPAVYTVDFPTGIPSGDKLIQAIGKVGSTGADSFRLAISPVQLTSSGATKANTSIYHGVPDAPAVTIQSFITTIQSTKRDTLADNLAFGSSTTYSEVNAEPRRWHLYATGSTTDPYTVNNDALKTCGNKALHVFASGYADTAGTNGGKEFGLYVLTTDATTAASSGSGTPLDQLPKEKIAGLVQVYHNAADPKLKNVDLYVGGIKQVIGLSFRGGFQSAGFIQDFDYNIGLTQKDSTTVALATTLRFDSDSVVSVISGVLDPAQFAANPDGESRALSFYNQEPARVTQPAGYTRVTVFHGATDAPTVSLTVPAVGGAALISALKYGNFQVADVPGVGTSLPTSLGNVLVDLNTPGGKYKSYIVPLGALDGKAVTVIASGFLDTAANQNGAGFRIFAGLPSSPFPQIVFLKDTAVVSSINDPSASDIRFRMFPNPVSSELTVAFNVEDQTEVSVEILDLNGRVVKTLVNGSFSNEVYADRFDVRGLNSGLYIARVKTGANTSSYKFNIAH